MHGAKAFKDFIDKKNTRVPEFLEVVAEQQEQVNKTDTDEASQRKKSRAISTSSQFGSTNYVFWVLTFYRCNTSILKANKTDGNN